MKMQESGKSLSTYNILKEQLGKDFVDNSLMEIIGFDNVLDKAESGNHSYESAEVSDEVAGILSNVDSAIIFATEKVSKEQKDRFQRYFANFLNEKSKVEDVRILMSEMIDDMTDSIDTKSVEDAYFDFVCLFTFDGRLKIKYPYIEQSYLEEFKHGHLHMQMLPQKEYQMMDKKFRDKFLIYLNKFYEKIDKSSDQDKMKVYFISELQRMQSGESNGIGNSMNPMIQKMTIDALFGRGDTREINGLFKKLLFKGKQNVPGTSENIRKKIGSILEKIISEYMFPQKYYEKTA